MLNNVPTGINRLCRNIVLNHPNTFACEVLRKTVTRAGGSGPGAAPTLGGLAVLDAQDEDKIQFRYVGPGFALPAEGFEPSPMMREGGASYVPNAEFRFLIEAEHPSGHEHHFIPATGDVIYLLLASGEQPPKMAFEITGSESMSNIPPYSLRYVCARRDDIDLLTPDDYSGEHAP